jgi:hypothetical protein
MFIMLSEQPIHKLTFECERDALVVLREYLQTVFHRHSDGEHPGRICYGSVLNIRTAVSTLQVADYLLLSYLKEMCEDVIISSASMEKEHLQTLKRIGEQFQADGILGFVKSAFDMIGCEMGRKTE